MREHKFTFGTYQFFDDYAIGKVNEGENIDLDKFLMSFSLCTEIFEDRPFGIISHRVNSYSVDPTCFMQLGTLLPNLKAYAIVASDQRQAQYRNTEKSFMRDFPSKTFDTIEEAVIWVHSCINDDTATE